jgi:hypothetical protein
MRSHLIARFGAAKLCQGLAKKLVLGLHSGPRGRVSQHPLLPLICSPLKHATDGRHLAVDEREKNRDGKLYTLRTLRNALRLYVTKGSEARVI